MEKDFLSVGIDIGTTTTQVIFSRLTIKPRTYSSSQGIISSRQILYRSNIHFTPLSSDTEINATKVAEIIQAEYCLAGLQPEDIDSGAVIITGETARKENAAAISEVLSLNAGKFVVATAGPELEAKLAGQGAGAAALSKENTGKVINFDIGGGTTNASVFFDGQSETPFALDIGGRLVRFTDTQHIEYISPRLQSIIKDLQLPLKVGQLFQLDVINILCRKLASILLDYCQGGDGGAAARSLLITTAPPVQQYTLVTFSGGVAEYIYKPSLSTDGAALLRYHDIGIILGRCINELFMSSALKVVLPKETIRATVIGAGVYSISLSGSTVYADDAILPLRNIPVISLPENIFTDIASAQLIAEQLMIYRHTPAALAFSGPQSPSYQQLRLIGAIIAAASNFAPTQPIIVILEHDFAKALGQSLRSLCGSQRKIICLDRIIVHQNSYIDIGQPLGSFLPVVIKTLAFQ